MIFVSVAPGYYPGYGKVLNADKKTIRRKRHRDWFMGAK